MVNTSASGGYLRPTSVAPLEDAALSDVLHDWIVGITGLANDMVRPVLQSEPPNIPDKGDVWCAFRVTIGEADEFPQVDHDATGSGSDTLRRQEVVDMLCSFYDDGESGHANANMTLLRDGSAIPQNFGMLRPNGMALVACDRPVIVPSLLKEQWLYRVDLPIKMRRQVDRVYEVQSLASANGTLRTDEGIIEPISVSQP